MNSSAINWDDTVLPFQLDKSDIRGRVARLDGVLNGVLKQHNYPDTVEALVAEMALLTAIIGERHKAAMETIFANTIKRCRSDDSNGLLRPI